MAATEIASSALPPSHRALILTSKSEKMTVKTIPTPSAVSGSAVVKVLAAGVVSYTREVYNGNRPNYPIPMPLTPGFGGVGRVAAVGTDSTGVKPGSLVFLDGFIRARDDRTKAFLMGVHQGGSEQSAKLMREMWRDGTFAEYVRLPLENVHVLDEERLTGGPGKGLGYDVKTLVAIGSLLVVYGGLRDVDVRAGETVLVAPATGGFGGAAVMVALAMGAGRVIAMGRSKEALQSVVEKSGAGKVVAVPMTGDVQGEVAAIKAEAAKAGATKGVDVFFDISPAEAAKSSHIKSGLLSLRHGGRMSMMGGFYGDMALPVGVIMHNDLKIRGKWMFNPEDVGPLLQLVHSGLLPLDYVRIVGSFALDEWEQALDVAFDNAGMGQQVVFIP